MIPVIAAGGIYNGEDIYNFLELGAAGVQMGTRFVATDECDADDAFKQTYIDAKKEDMVIIKSPVGTARQGDSQRIYRWGESRQEKTVQVPFSLH